jgi:nucleotide-binding universal stress UspA family protein
MITFLVPTDFSENSKNAARFAANLANVVPGAQLTLYNVFDTIEAGSDGTPLNSDDAARQSVMELLLASVKSELSAITAAPIKLVVEEEHNFVDSLDRYVRHNDIQLVIMGITGTSRLEQRFVGSNTLSLVEKQTVPVMIVPPDAEFKAAKNIMMISDFKDVGKTIPQLALKTVLNLFKADLHIVNVDSEHYVQITEQYRIQRDLLNEMLKEFNPEFYFIRMYNFMEAINQFVIDKNIDLILTIPKSHNFLSHFFKTTHTNKLAYHSYVPIIAVHS